MLQPLIIDAEGIAHGFKVGTVRPVIGMPRHGTKMSWCGTSLQEYVRLGGHYSSVAHQESGYDPRKAVTCLSCLSEGP
jgi:hypothetical protein